MNLLFFNEVIKSDLAAAIAWTLLHSTWQGMLAAIIAGVIVIVTKKHTASLRYHLYSAVFLIFLVAITITFVVQYNNQLETNNIPVQQLSQSVDPVTEKPSGTVAVIPGLNSLNTIITKADFLLHQYHPFLFTIWLLVFGFKLFFMLTGFRWMNRLRRHGVQPVDLHWQNLVNRLSHSLGIERHVQLLESANIAVPMMTGFFKPVILVPLGICCHLPPAEMEAILLHELAHIRRSDYLMNLLQRLMETIFFFNPCILWVSSLMRDERENCCDDMAVNVIRNKEQYIHALVAFQEYNLTYQNTQAIAFAGSRQRLLHRVRRLLINENKKLNHMEKMILVCSMVVLSAAFSISSGTLQAQDRNKPLRETLRREATDPRNKHSDQEIIDDDNNHFEHVSTINSSNNGRKTTIITVIDQYGKKYVLRKTDGKVSRLSINDREIDENDFPEYKEIIKKIETGKAANRNSKPNNTNTIPGDAEREIMLSREAELLARQHRANELEMDKQHRELDNLQRALELRNHKNGPEAEKFMQAQQELNLLQKIAQERLMNEKQLLQEHKLMTLDRISQERKIALEHQEHLKQELREEQFRNNAERDQMRKALKMENLRNQNNNRNNSIEDELTDLEPERIVAEKQMLLERKMALRERAQEQQNNMNLKGNRINSRNDNDNDEIHSILELLEEEGIISDLEKVSFNLNIDELVVNGKRQPGSIHEVFKERYIHNKCDTVIYEKNMNSTKKTIHRNR